MTKSGDISFSSSLVSVFVDRIKAIAAETSNGSFFGVKENNVLTKVLENLEH